MFTWRRVLAGILWGCTLLGAAGCFRAPATPQTLEVVLPDDARQEAEAGTGPQSLAGGTWVGFRKPDPDEPPPAESTPPPGPYGGLLDGGILDRPPADEPMFRVVFAADGRVTGIHDNQYFLADIYGSTLAVDGTVYSTTIPGIAFSAQSFGVSVEDAFGVAILVDVRFVGLPVGRAVIYSWGRGDAQRVDGQFGYLLDFSGGLGDLLLDTNGDQYPFYATRQE